MTAAPRDICHDMWLIPPIAQYFRAGITSASTATQCQTYAVCLSELCSYGVFEHQHCYTGSIASVETSLNVARPRCHGTGGRNQHQTCSTSFCLLVFSTRVREQHRRAPGVDNELTAVYGGLTRLGEQH